ncbi:MAG: rhomboid family intramembrane serine protease, partial [Phycisphaerae bacterium]
MFIPLRAHVPTDRRAWANCAILLATVVLSFAGFRDTDFAYTMMGFEPVPTEWPEELEKLEPYMVREPPKFRQTLPVPVSSVTSAFLHQGLGHLVGNMLFLWVFGNAVNYKLGHLKYLALYVLSALGSGAAHHVFCGGPLIGASGAIYGVVGAFLVFFPRNDVTAIWFYAIFWLKTFYISSVWVILYWVAWDVLCIIWVGTEGPVAYWAHVGGFAAGFAIALLLAATGWVKPKEDERTLLQVFGIRREARNVY